MPSAAAWHTASNSSRPADDMVDIDDPRAPRSPRRADDVAQQQLAVLDWAAPQVVTVEVQQVEREIGELNLAPVRDRLTQRIKVCHTACVGHRDSPSMTIAGSPASCRSRNGSRNSAVRS